MNHLWRESTEYLKSLVRSKFPGIVLYPFTQVMRHVTQFSFVNCIFLGSCNPSIHFKLHFCEKKLKQYYMQNYKCLK